MAKTPRKWKLSPLPTKSPRKPRNKAAAIKPATRHAAATQLVHPIPPHLYKKPSNSKSAKSNAPSMQKSSKNAATATIGKTGRATLPKSPAPILTASTLFWKTLPTKPNALPSKPLLPNCAMTSITPLATKKSSKCWRST